MGMLVEGRWVPDDRNYRPRTDSTGRFVRVETQFRDWVTADGSSGFAPEPGRYHLYVSLACPWAHRTVILRKLKGLEQAISLSIVDPFMGADGWAFGDAPGCIPDTVHGARFLKEVYLQAKPRYTGRVSVPVLWDKQRKTIVNNESSEIIRMLNSAFDAFTNIHTDYYPENLRSEIDKINDLVYPNINNGVYRAGFATAQGPYEIAFRGVFDTLDDMEQRLSQHRYLVGDTITEADWRLF